MPQTRDQREASHAVAAWLARRERSNAWLVNATKADPGTIGTFLAGTSWPKLGTQGRIEKALGWRAGTIRQIGVGDHRDDWDELMNSEPDRTVGGGTQAADRTTDEADDYVAAPGEQTHGGTTDAALLETIRELRDAVDRLNDRLDRQERD